MDLVFLSQLNMLRCPATKHAAFAVCLPLSQLGTTHVPSHPKAQGKARGRSGSVCTIDSKTDICQVDKLTKLVPFHFRNCLKNQHPPNTSCVSKSRPPSIYLGPEAPLAKHQACAPSLPMLLPLKSIFVTVLLTFKASARACGQSDGKPEELRYDLSGH